MRQYKSGMRWCLWRWTDVVLGGELYLRRLHIFTPRKSNASLDPAPGLAVMHDHPVSFISWMLRGSYTEETPEGTRTWPRWSMHLMRATDRHRIVITGPNTLTLVLAGPVVRSWGGASTPRRAGSPGGSTTRFSFPVLGDLAPRERGFSFVPLAGENLGPNPEPCLPPGVGL
jgi:hypothetical protein